MRSDLRPAAPDTFTSISSPHEMSRPDPLSRPFAAAASTYSNDAVSGGAPERSSVKSCFPFAIEPLPFARPVSADAGRRVPSRSPANSIRSGPETALNDACSPVRPLRVT